MLGKLKISVVENEFLKKSLLKRFVKSLKNASVVMSRIRKSRSNEHTPLGDLIDLAGSHLDNAKKAAEKLGDPKLLDRVNKFLSKLTKLDI